MKKIEIATELVSVITLNNMMSHGRVYTDEEKAHMAVKAANANNNYVDVRTGRVYEGAELKKGIVVDLTGSTESAHLFHFKDIG